MTKPDPNKLLDELCKAAHPRTAASLRIIYDICQEQEERGSADYSVATIGKLASAKGGPSAPAIRNKTGERYRALVAAYADYVGGRKKKGASLKPSIADELLEGITDPVLRARINLMAADLEATRAQLQAARHLASKNAVLVLGDSAPSPIAEPSCAEMLTAQEKKALAAAISEKTLEHWGWKVDKNGRVLTDRGQVVFDAGFATAIQKLVT
jgi:hypothetical protein